MFSSNRSFQSLLSISRNVTHVNPFMKTYQHHRFTHVPCFPFSVVRGLPKVLDVLRLGQDQNGYFINFPGRTMPMPMNANIAEAQLSLLESFGFGEMHFRNKQGIQYSATTPIEILVKDDFYVELENQHFFIVNTSKTSFLQLGAQGFFPSPSDSMLEVKLQGLAQSLGNSQEQNKIISSFLSVFIEHLSRDKKEFVDKQHLNLILSNVLNELSIHNRKEISTLDSLIQVVEKKLSHDLAAQSDINKSLVEKKLHKFFKRFFAMVVAQVALIQYGTYIFISWDFMEPITCLLGIADTILAFGYWSYVNSEYGYDTLARRKMEKLKQSKTYTSQFDESDVFERRDILEYLYRQKLYLSNSLPSLLKIFASQQDIFNYVQSVAADNKYHQK